MAVSTKRLYERFREIGLEISYLQTAYAMLDWDKAVCMPLAAEEMRAEVLGDLARLVHVRATSREYGAVLRKLAAAADKGKLSRQQAIIIRDELEEFVQNRKLPAAFVEELATLSAESELVWNRARPDSDWKTYRPKLKALVRMSREKAALRGYETSPYDGMLQDFEPDVDVVKLDAMFGELKPRVVDLVRRIGESSHGPTAASRKRYARFDRQPVADQRLRHRDVMEALGFDFEAGRLDETGHHPFTLDIHRGDVRITTTLDRKAAYLGLLTTVHETGHALYAQGLPMRHYGTSGCMVPSFGIDESQSRLYENHVGRSLAFCEWLYGARNGRLLYRHANAVRPSHIRIDADEVTYPLHIVLRYEIERALIEGKLSVDDAPDAWHEKTREYLGIETPDHRHGIMQDGHWAGGNFGYFPSYALGDIYAAQLFAKATSEIHGLEGRMRRGNFGPLRDWLLRKVHRHGGLLNATDIVKRASGEAPDARFLTEHLERRYGELYKL